MIKELHVQPMPEKVARVQIPRTTRVRSTKFWRLGCQVGVAIHGTRKYQLAHNTLKHTADAHEQNYVVQVRTTRSSREAVGKSMHGGLPHHLGDAR